MTEDNQPRKGEGWEIFDSYVGIGEALKKDLIGDVDRYDEFDTATDMLNYISGINDEPGFAPGEEDMNRALELLGDLECPECRKILDGDAPVTGEPGEDTVPGIETTYWTNEMEANYREDKDVKHTAYVLAYCPEHPEDVNFQYKESWFSEKEEG